MQIQGITPQPMHEAADLAPSKKQDETKLKDACQQFESLFLSQMLKEMISTRSFGQYFRKDRSSIELL